MSLEKTARSSKFVEWREVKQDVQLSDDKQTKSFLPEKTAQRSKLVERRQTIQTEDFPPRGKQHDVPNWSSGNEQYKTFLPEENNTGTSTSQAIQIRVKQFFNCHLSGSFNVQTCLKHVKELFLRTGNKKRPSTTNSLEKQAQISSHVTLRHEQNRKRMNGSHTGP